MHFQPVWYSLMNWIRCTMLILHGKRTRDRQIIRNCELYSIKKYWRQRKINKWHLCSFVSRAYISAISRIVVPRHPLLLKSRHALNCTLFHVLASSQFYSSTKQQKPYSSLCTYCSIFFPQLLLCSMSR